jgi:hypothetical protein
MLFHEQPSDPWVEFDFMLLEAYQMLQEETCNECGNPIWICRNEDANWIGFKVKTSKCFAKAEIEKWQEAQEKKSAKKDHGSMPYVIAFSYDERPMPSRRDFFTGLSDKIE